MRILYVHRTQGVGAEGNHVLGMYEAFAELGHEMSMQCPPGCNPAENAARPSPAVAGGRPSLFKRVYWLVTERMPQPAFEFVEIAYNLPLLALLAWRFLRRRPDLVYERYSLNSFAAALACRLAGIPLVLEVNDSVTIERSRPLRFAAAAGAIEGFCVRRAALVITITEKFKSNLVERYRLPGSRVLVLTNAVSARRFRARTGPSPLKSDPRWKGKTVIGGTGQFLPWHGLQELLEALAPEMARRDLFLLFVGDGPVREGLLARAAELGLGERVGFTGMVPLSAVPEHLSVLDIAVIPSAAPHASPMKLMEYMAMGLPIVAPDLPSIRAAVPGDGLARIFPAGDMAAMKSRLLDMLDRPEEARSLGRAARERVFAELTWTRHAELVLASVGGPGAG